VGDDDTAGGDIRIAIAKLSERSQVMSGALVEVKTAIKDMQATLIDLSKSRVATVTGDQRLVSDLRETMAEVEKLNDWKQQSMGSARMFRWILSVTGAAILATLTWLFTTVSSDHTEIALDRQIVRDHIHQDDLRAGKAPELTP
jgi:hypothetical protein